MIKNRPQVWADFTGCKVEVTAGGSAAYLHLPDGSTFDLPDESIEIKEEDLGTVFSPSKDKKPAIPEAVRKTIKGKLDAFVKLAARINLDVDSALYQDSFHPAEWEKIGLMLREMGEQLHIVEYLCSRFKWLSEHMEWMENLAEEEES